MIALHFISATDGITYAFDLLILRYLHDIGILSVQMALGLGVQASFSESCGYFSQNIILWTY